VLPVSIVITLTRDFFTTFALDVELGNGFDFGGVARVVLTEVMEGFRCARGKSSSSSSSLSDNGSFFGSDLTTGEAKAFNHIHKVRQNLQAHSDPQKCSSHLQTS